MLPGGSGYFTCIQNMKLVTTKFKSGGLHEKHVVATWNSGNHLSIYTRRKLESLSLMRRHLENWPRGPAVSMRSELLLAHEKLEQLLLLTVYVVSV